MVRVIRETHLSLSNAVNLTRLGLAVLIVVALPWLTPNAGQPRVVAQEPSHLPIVAKATSLAGTFASQVPGLEGVKILPAEAELTSNQRLITLPGAALQSKNGAIGLKSLADYDGRAPLPTLETAFLLHEARMVDLELTLDRGRLDLVNIKSEGPATARIRFWDQVWTITLDSPGSQVDLQLYGRWPPGSRFRVAGQPGSAKVSGPVADLVLLVVKGSAAVDVGGLSYGLKTPPGPAILGWDSVTGTNPQPQKVEQMPVWADSGAVASERGKLAAAAVERFRAARAESPSTAQDTFFRSMDSYDRRVALVNIGATDDLTSLVKAISGAKTPEVWDFAIRVARHWLGRCAGQDQKFYAALISPQHGYSPAQARIIMRLLFGFSGEDLKRPETYEVLIDYLNHDQSIIRNLAAWHLVRTVPEGKSIVYKPGSTQEECVATARAWKKLIPTGHLPTQSAKKD